MNRDWMAAYWWVGLACGLTLGLIVDWRGAVISWIVAVSVLTVVAYQTANDPQRKDPW